jgi:voltage-gated sodium channel
MAGMARKSLVGKEGNSRTSVSRLLAQKEEERMLRVSVLPEDEPQGPVPMIEHWLFNGVIMSGICVNALQMGLELQFEGDPWDTVWLICENFFTAFFLGELLIKLPKMGFRKFFSAKANILDFIVVVVAVVDNWFLTYVISGGDSGGMGFISLLRLIRLGRILKLLKAKKELMMLIEGILSSIKSMFWLSILLAILIFIVSIVFVKFIGRSGVYDDDAIDIEYYFGDMLKASVTGLNLAMMADWGVILRPIIKRQPVFALVVGVYVGISCFGIMNAIIGVIVTRTSEAAAEAQAEDELGFRMRQMEFVESIQDIIYEIDIDGDGTVSPEEIAGAEDNEVLKEALEAVDVPLGFSMGELHCMLDKDGDGELTKGEFSQGMKRLIFSNDFQRQCLLMLAVAQQKRKLYEVKVGIDEEVGILKEKIDRLPDQFDAILTKAIARGGFGSGPPADPDKILPDSACEGMGNYSRQICMNADDAKLRDGGLPGSVAEANIVNAGKNNATVPVSQQVAARAAHNNATAHALAEVSQAFATAAQYCSGDKPIPMPVYNQASYSDGFNRPSPMRLLPGIVNQNIIQVPNEATSPGSPIRHMTGAGGPRGPDATIPAMVLPNGNGLPGSPTMQNFSNQANPQRMPNNQAWMQDGSMQGDGKGGGKGGGQGAGRSPFGGTTTVSIV